MMSSITYTPHSGISLNLGTPWSHMLVQHDVKAHIIPTIAMKINTTKIPVLFMIVIYSYQKVQLLQL